MIRIVLALALLALAGCQTCREHPVVCAAGLTIAATSIALSARHGSEATRDAHIPNLDCTQVSCK